MSALKAICFHILSSFRIIILLLLKLVRFIAIVASIFMTIGNLLSKNALWWIVAVWIVVFILSSVLMHYYDVLILKLKPDDLDITLYK